MVGMLVHLDASTHEWVRGLPMWDLMVALDDADGRILHARLVKQEGVASTLEALEAHGAGGVGNFVFVSHTTEPERLGGQYGSGQERRSDRR